MAGAKKFGAFSGVFTPSILTILGVIMYLRLPWITGQAGLWSTIAIVLVAHLISVTTGLSVSSIATDKKVKAGGNYYIISRSLGLPIGGMLGLALFVGLSFSVSLYLIGFSESLLAALGMEITPNTIRISGTIALLALTTITFISTALALKTQFFVLAMIVLSLISVLLGSHDLVPAQPHFNSLPGAPSWMVLFGIFFPAVTGFEAGVSMSGDLKDPKRSIPAGTISAITVGLLVYLGLPFFFAYTVDANALANDTNVLLKIAYVPILVTIGILAATFSSAMGSILGAPRILQATSVDRITPKFFAKGHGRENEPRNALLLTFLIAEGGILLGELNLIARIVSMFFITTYGFLNMSCALESWASADFRPEFKIPRVVSVIGSLACFIVMIQLDFLAMIGATVVMGAIFVSLKRKELTLESGDTWEGVWSSVVRSGLYRLTHEIPHPRNWRPNIILFSGGVSARPYLVQLGKWLIYKRGVLSDFELLESPPKESSTARKGLPPKSHQVVVDKSHGPGIFTRRLAVEDIYQGMENVCQFYGFSGMEPNTVMMGWARNAQSPEKFSRLISHLHQLDYNVLLLDYDRERGYGDHKQVDIWWRGWGNNLSLALALVRFLLSTDEWEKTAVRILIVNNADALTGAIRKNMQRVLEEYRIEAEVKVIQNGIEQRPFEEIIKVESKEADLVILGLPEFTPDKALPFVQRIDAIVGELGSILLIWASSYFKEIYVGIESAAPAPARTPETAAGEFSLPELALPEDERIAPLLAELDSRMADILSRYRDEFLKRVEKSETGLIDDLGRLSEQIFGNLDKYFDEEDPQRSRKLINRSHSDFLFQSQQILTEFQQKRLSGQKEALEEGAAWLLQEIEALIAAGPEQLTVFYESARVQPDPQDRLSLKFLKFRKRMRARLTGKPVSRAVRLQSLLKYYLQFKLPQHWYAELEKAAVCDYQGIAEVQKLIHSLREGLLRIEYRQAPENLAGEDISAERQKAEKQLALLRNTVRETQADFYRSLRENARGGIQALSQDLQDLEIRRKLKKEYRVPKSAAALRQQIAEAPEAWLRHRETYLNIALLDVWLMSLQNRVRVIVQRIRQDINLNLEANLLHPLKELCRGLEAVREEGKESEDRPAALARLAPGGQFNFDEDEIAQTFLKEIREATDDLPETIETFNEESFNQSAAQPFEEAARFTISLRRLVEYLIEEEFIDPLRDYLEKLPRQFRRAEEVTRDALRLVTFQAVSLEEAGNAEEKTAARENIDAILESSQKRVEEERRNIDALQEQFNQTIERLLDKTFEQMNTYTVTRLAENLKHYIRTHEGQKVLSKFEAARESAAAFLKDKLVRLWYRRSESLLAARKLQVSEEYQKNIIYQLLNLRESVSPRPEVLNALPFYYRQVFSREPNIHPNFWVAREKELKLGETALERFRAGFPGALLVTGEENSGKTSLCYSLAHKQFARNNIFSVHPPAGGTIDPEVFREAVMSALRAKDLYLRGQLPQVFNALPPNSVLILDDLELWWERSEKGFAVIDLIVELINDFGGKCFFIANGNLHSFQLLNRIRKIENHFLGFIECQPFDAEALKDAVMLRHRSTGLKIELNGQAEDELSELRLARLFNAYFDYSAGNVGAALQGWISHIENFNQGRLALRLPEPPDTASLENLESAWVALLAQVLLHKRLTPARLERIMDDPAQEWQAPLAALKRAGLVIEGTNGTLEIDPYLYPHLYRKFRQMEIL
ncbi:MAG: amino acid permease [Calditrichaceae bacterium]|nr:amino acid permease [Calditrichia bacterium]NUQ39765.1 amino acid permease [Calditrichaceae bacterium]